MEKWKKLTIITIGAIALIAGLSAVADLYAQDQDHAPGVYRTPEEMQKPVEEGINSGWVVAYGVLLKRPYFVEFRDDTVWINNVSFSPTKKAPGWKRRTVVASHMDSLKFFTTDTLVEKYLQYLNTKGEQNARELIKEEYKDNSLITKIEFGPERFTLHLEYVDGSRQNILWDPSMPESPSYEERIREKYHDVEGIKSYLRSGGMIVFSYKPPTTYYPADLADELLQVVRDVKDGKLSLQKGEMRLGEMTTKKQAEEIIENIESWR
jgi:hypothetical protein